MTLACSISGTNGQAPSYLAYDKGQYLGAGELNCLLFFHDTMIPPGILQKRSGTCESVGEKTKQAVV
jgi:hypothetical protein